MQLGFRLSMSLGCYKLPFSFRFQFVFNLKRNEKTIIPVSAGFLFGFSLSLQHCPPPSKFPVVRFVKRWDGIV